MLRFSRSTLSLSLREALKKQNCLIVDVRSNEEVQAGGGCPGAVHVPVGEVPKSMSVFGSDKTRPIVFYCRKGIRAADAAAFLSKHHGFQNAFSATDGETVAKILSEK